MRRVLIACTLASLVLAACGGSGGGASSGVEYAEKDAPVSFSYPDSMHELTVSVREIQGRKPRFHVAVGEDGANRVVVETYKLSQPREHYEAKAFAAAVDKVALTIARSQKPRLQLSPARTVKLGGLDGFQYDLRTTDGIVQRMTFAFRGSDQLFVRCVWDPDAGLAADVQAACNQVEKSVKLR
jgi:hypothetical protein